ncbi:extracellular solute-binding protein [Halalkalibacterium halodurans]|uniref:BH1064 protein n=1 Tax=Halalkalibacterium halodurans (strain ATCC BAA-125 / DSM 18197 / FERM 7344 / JCM 9153 / C-125) TaxID=272558 RepID=Q9KDZ7_HALH5|nr:extracellular solute-binding protein [Halalkalibacterium halodurans]MDY7221597.1 extracellular solute-binding protein [Halalkalibacterium halodurans]MDY7240873.1 extracellular solute-binding protein [Halalkalibacterium halodurans]MED4079267.1 extracellular solute-binding protein [Halalkalibacterium halodurans]MED4085338.1 extracellular solute-binding protein [Halalkalibacterium halodurans]MED4105374.1 extracellular solute-binding protein [Halalkalibacterium halodurans]
MKKRIVHSFLVGLLAVGILTACSQEGSTTEDETNTNEDGTVTITTARTLDDGTVFKDGEDVHDNVVTRWAEEELGIKFVTEWTQPNDEQFNTQLRLMMSSGEKLPDVFQVNDTAIKADLLSSGLVMPVDEAIETYASPRLKQLFEQFPQAFYPSTKDGVRYGIPRFSGGNGSDTLLWIRQDWLDKFDLEPPTTLEELEHIMDVFVNEDPNETGKNDTIGITFAAGDYGFRGGNIADSSWVFGAFGDFVPGAWSKGDDGSLVYGSIQPSMKDGLAKIHEWYEKGYLATDFAILSAGDAQESFISGRSGIMAAPPWAHGYPIGEMAQVVPDAIVKPFPHVSGPNGQAGRRGEGYVVGSFLFNKDFEHMDKFFEYWDAIYGYTFGESDYFEYGLFEGYDYVMEDGEPVYDHAQFEEITGEEVVDPGRYFLPTNVPTIPFEMYSLLEEFHETGREPETGYEAGLAGRDPDYIEAAAIVNRQNDLRIINEFNGPPTPTMVSRSEHLERMEDELFVDIIYGNKPLDAFDQFVEEWRQSGGEAITEEVNEWYESVQQ